MVILNKKKVLNVGIRAFWYIKEIKIKKIFIVKKSVLSKMNQFSTLLAFLLFSSDKKPFTKLKY